MSRRGLFQREGPRRVWAAAAFLLCAAGAAAPAPALADDAPKSLLQLPVASGTPGQEWAARALGGLLEEGFGSLRTVRLVAGTARETALRELSASPAIKTEEFLAVCLRAGADLAVFGGATLVEGRLSLELRAFDIRAAGELKTFRGESPVSKAFELIAEAVRHVAAEAGLGVVEVRFPRGGTASLEAYAAYRAAIVEESPARRIEQLRAVLKLDGNYLDATLRLGVELFREGALDEALGVLERAVALGPKVAEARNNYGVVLAAAGKPEPAQREFEEAMALAADYAEARLNLARVLEERGRATDAEKQYTTLLEADAGNDKARFGLAALYDRTGRPELAIKEFRLLSARRPDLAEAEFIRVGQEARKAREYARAEKYFLRATEVNPQFAQAWAELGTNSYLSGEYPKGVEYFRKALAIEPGQAAYHYYLGLALDKDRQGEEAQREYRRAVELGGPPEARLGLARSALESGDPGLAVEELNRLLAVSPDNSDAKNLLAQATSEMEARRRLMEEQSQFANQRLARLEQIIEDSNRTNRVLTARLQEVIQEKLQLEEQMLSSPSAATGGSGVSTRPREPARGSEYGAELRVRLATLQNDLDRAQAELQQEREARLALAERLQASQAATDAARAELARKTGEAGEFKGLLAAAERAVAKAEESLKAERERGEKALSLERKARSAEEAKLREEIEDGRFTRQDKKKLTQELDAEKARSAEAQAKAEKALAAALAQARADQAARENAEQTLAAERERAAQTLAAEREERRRESAARQAGYQADLALLKERLAAAEARAAAESKTLAGLELALASARQAVRDLALELGRNALQDQSWEKARLYLEQAAEADPASGEAWYGLGEAYYQLGQFEKSRQMYQRAKEIY